MSDSLGIGHQIDQLFRFDVVDDQILFGGLLLSGFLNTEVFDVLLIVKVPGGTLVHSLRLGGSPKARELILMMVDIVGVTQYRDSLFASVLETFLENVI